MGLCRIPQNIFLDAFGGAAAYNSSAPAAPAADQFLKGIAVNTALPRRASERVEVGSPHKITRCNDFHGSGMNSRSCRFPGEFFKLRFD